jgi:hypothetical protein
MEKIINKGASTPDELQQLADSLDLKLNFIGSMYNMPENIKNGNYIMLITPSSKVKDGHWVCFKAHNNFIMYFDSYGVPAPDILKQYGKDIIYNDKQIQDMRSSHCGLYCLYFLKYGNKILKKFNQYNIL